MERDINHKMTRDEKLDHCKEDLVLSVEKDVERKRGEEDLVLSVGRRCQKRT